MLSKRLKLLSGGVDERLMPGAVGAGRASLQAARGDTILGAGFFFFAV